MFEDVLDEAKKNYADNDLGRVVIHHPSLNDAIVVPLQPLHQLNKDAVLQTIENVLQSHEDLSISDGFDINIGIINVPKGSGRLRITSLTGTNNFIHRKQSLVKIINADHLCLARAIAMSWTRLHTVTTRMANDGTQRMRSHTHVTTPDGPEASLQQNAIQNPTRT